VFERAAPHECYHLGGPSKVDSNVSGSAQVFVSILESTRALLAAMRDSPRTRLFFAGSSEIFGNARESPQDELSQPSPRSVYGLGKLAAWDLIATERRKRGLFACVGILYNHESVRRPTTFLSRKVSLSVARIAAGLQEHLLLGNLEAQRDWGYAPDYVDAMVRILQTTEPQDYVIATGKLHSVAELVAVACRELSVDPDRCVRLDKALYRPSEVVALCGNSMRLRKATGWQPTVHFDRMISEMVRHDFKSVLEHETRRPHAQ
jgi:GDPmannose 4,6-dehydratase